MRIVSKKGGGVFLRRWLAIGVIMLSCFIVVFYETNASDRRFFLPEPLAGIKIVLDAGHGGEDGGASKGDVIEKDITLTITKKVARQLQRYGAEVVLTRSTDGDVLTEHEPNEQYPTLRERKKQDLFLREKIIEQEQPNLFVSIHANAIPNTKWRGAQVFYHPDGQAQGQDLAKSVQKALREELGNTEREALSIKQVYLLKKSPVPSILVETGFISNDEERALLVDEKYQQKVADAIARGIRDYYNFDVD